MLILQSSQYLFLHSKFVILMGGKGVLFLLWQSRSWEGWDLGKLYPEKIPGPSLTFSMDTEQYINSLCSRGPSLGLPAPNIVLRERRWSNWRNYFDLRKLARCLGSLKQGWRCYLQGVGCWCVLGTVQEVVARSLKPKAWASMSRSIESVSTTGPRLTL